VDNSIIYLVIELSILDSNFNVKTIN
jgi:hypothetical protein